MSDQQRLQNLIKALERYLAAKGGPDEEWMESFNGLMKALRDAKAAV